MSKYTLIKNAKLVNEGTMLAHDVLIKDQMIEKIGYDLSHDTATVIDAEGKFLLPGVIDDQVHFREPGLTHKAEIYTESRAAVAGGITSFMEMPNTVPNTLTQELLQDKYDIGAEKSLANYSFFMGASNDNLEEVLKTNRRDVCGIKVFMGSSTGNMLVDDEETLNNLFSRAEMLVAAHCEDEGTIRKNMEIYKERYGDDIPFTAHPLIRSEDACYISSSKAVALAKKNGTKFHVLHISTGKETELFDNSVPLKDKLVTSEACIHHMWFSDEDYVTKGGNIKWNPAVKTAYDRDMVFQAMLDDKIDVIATDHAPHTMEEKNNGYLNCPSGGPLVQHALPAMMEHYLNGKISIERIVEKMSHNPAILFEIEKRGYIREGYYADLVLVDTTDHWVVNKGNVLSKCGWSPFEGQKLRSKITHTFVSGHLAYQEGAFDESQLGKRLLFDRK
ncbi:dihydroorotase [Reichenbachiella agariperforans]|uniref:Dihydroorotase n=1 Tax=Reichenbachiella agariperforans TaxID=156994 RepID=A0A1M6RKM9_REIAG|nr:dihydroorotase [Reichenbachiella agariperforans]SHK32928.1 dihydroorotase [Reichenbachiella agariperforans]